MAVPVKSTKLVPAKSSTSSNALYFIGVYKLFECGLLIAAGIGLHRLLNRDMAETVNHLVHVIRADPNNHYIHRAMEKAFAVSPKQLRELSFGTFFYAFLRFAEGIGLVLRKRWGEYLTIAVTGLFIPLEMWEVARHVTPVRTIVLLLNVLIVVYLIWNLRRHNSAAGRNFQIRRAVRS